MSSRSPAALSWWPHRRRMACAGAVCAGSKTRCVSPASADDEHAPDDELEGITQNKLPSDASAADMRKLAGWVNNQEPDVVLVDRVDDFDTAAELVKYAAKEKRLYVGIRAGSTMDAVSMWRKLVGDDRQAVKYLQLVIVEKLVRKLCSACKAEYAPDPETLRRLNMSPDKVGSLYQARTQPLRDPKGNAIPCEFCHDLRFKGRTGVFEMLAVDAEVRKTLNRAHRAISSRCSSRSRSRNTCRKTRSRSPSLGTPACRKSRGF